MANSTLNTIIQQIENLTSNEQIFLAHYLDDLAHSPSQSPIIRSRFKIIQSQRTEILKLASIYGASNVKIFSLEQSKDDTHNHKINFLVDLEEDRSLFDLGGLLMDIRELLGFEVVVFTQTTLKDDYRDQVLQNAIVL
jgi:predicted nucleotidyltransferase